MTHSADESIAMTLNTNETLLLAEHDRLINHVIGTREDFHELENEHATLTTRRHRLRNNAIATAYALLHPDTIDMSEHLWGDSNASDTLFDMLVSTSAEHPTVLRRALQAALAIDEGWETFNHQYRSERTQRLKHLDTIKHLQNALAWNRRTMWDAITSAEITLPEVNGPDIQLPKIPTY